MHYHFICLCSQDRIQAKSFSCWFLLKNTPRASAPPTSHPTASTIACRRRRSGLRRTSRDPLCRKTTSCNTLRCYLLLLSDVACDENYFFPATNQIKSRAAPQIRVSDASNFVADLRLGCFIAIVELEREWSPLSPGIVTSVPHFVSICVL